MHLYFGTLNHQMRQPNTAVFSLFIMNIAYMRILMRLFVSFGTPIFLPFLLNVPFNWHLVVGICKII